ncbi:MAG: nicotinate-nucleotide adenylyltransferase [Candidatus Thiodiazotropha lotti]|uniref:Probable nicotinate-nucleotide adenylyltransferase n=1 Tax=Candidatus Thiodiazotropha lotti TaxID=2792787 RepID=A0A9E4K6S2_9GAMM|nr:nicotinate-nucleotide adenylyltransferase [Candidatus Thiodiazotropha lotti]ODB98820.1 nicotinate (nicotinamide) nucleotide adenylyltransferase [Candidatus Thiodiazotropha endoloripes]MCG7921879.1 nicotinate-nucleotide adenylyltransferase [Candidatus Thiodiazotropha lotti]MCG7932375.1 nicotinate-nucleotide adenylyltransferase [Candidatus Thiodiazotropha lotti]MCG7940465.1 nicotinate-nucleotide adenylyltransferase [Candidatus Thiodiazotropha lotti]
MIGILGGTFDPIHNGHLRTALDVMQAVGLKQVRFIPLHGPVHRDQPQASTELRLRMVEAAITEQPGFVADDRELRRAGDSYTVDTLRDLHHDFPDQPLLLLMGMDAFSGFPDWHKPDEILQLAHLVVMRRPGESQLSEAARGLLQRHESQPERQFNLIKAGGIRVQTVTQLDISASLIRNLIKQDESPRYLLPEAVLQIIHAEGLYRD